jgi:hypothetical protein
MSPHRSNRMITSHRADLDVLVLRWCAPELKSEQHVGLVQARRRALGCKIEQLPDVGGVVSTQGHGSGPPGNCPWVTNEQAVGAGIQHGHGAGLFDHRPQARVGRTAGGSIRCGSARKRRSCRFRAGDGGAQRTRRNSRCCAATRADGRDRRCRTCSATRGLASATRKEQNGENDGTDRRPYQVPCSHLSWTRPGRQRLPGRTNLFCGLPMR